MFDIRAEMVMQHEQNLATPYNRICSSFILFERVYNSGEMTGDGLERNQRTSLTLDFSSPPSLSRDDLMNFLSFLANLSSLSSESEPLGPPPPPPSGAPGFLPSRFDPVGEGVGYDGKPNISLSLSGFK